MRRTGSTLGVNDLPFDPGGSELIITLREVNGISSHLLIPSPLHKPRDPGGRTYILGISWLLYHREWDPGGSVFMSFLNPSLFNYICFASSNICVETCVGELELILIEFSIDGLYYVC